MLKKAWPWLVAVLSLIVIVLLDNWQHTASDWLQFAAMWAGFWALLTGRLGRR